MASTDGPASAAGVAGLRAAIEDRRADPDHGCICVLTGNGLKDPDTAVAAAPAQIVVTDAAQLGSALGW